MNLHRTTGKPDWATVKKADYNVFQKVAAATHSLITPANLITIIGLGIVVYGLIELFHQQYWWGLILLAVGRLLDVVDGVVAQATNTKSPTGEMFDAVADKIGTLLTIITLYAAQISSWWIITLLLIPQVIIPLIILYKRQKGVHIHPTRQGKLSMAFSWAAIVGLLITKATNDSMIFAGLSYILVGLGVILGLYALWQYATERDQN